MRPEGEILEYHGKAAAFRWHKYTFCIIHQGFVDLDAAGIRAGVGKAIGGSEGGRVGYDLRLVVARHPAGGVDHEGRDHEHEPESHHDDYQ